MNTPLPAADELATLVERLSGNVVPAGHHHFLGEIARRRAVALGLADLAAYVKALARGDLTDEWRWLLPHVTVKESYLFRTPQHFAALSAVVLPGLLASRGASRELSVWSAGCARGEEPATLAIVLAEQEALAGWNWRVFATDVDEDALAAARLGLFGQRAVASVPPAILAKYFAPRGDLFELHPQIRSRIDFRALNLVHEPLQLPPRPFDLTFLRNVLIYFRVESQRRVAARVAEALAPDGVLFLGPAETLWQVCEQLEPVDLDDCFCYRRRADSPGRAEEREDRSRPVAASTSGRPPAARSALRVSGHPAEPAVGGDHRPTPKSIGTHERLSAAAAHLAANRLAEAAEQVEQALRADPTDPSAHAIEGLLHDVSGRSQMAFASYRAALFLDDGLFQVRLLLADTLRRLGGVRRAELEYRRVLATLTSGRPRELEALAGLPLPTRDQALRRCRQALGQG